MEQWKKLSTIYTPSGNANCGTDQDTKSHIESQQKPHIDQSSLSDKTAWKEPLAGHTPSNDNGSCMQFYNVTISEVMNAFEGNNTTWLDDLRDGTFPKRQCK